MSKESDTLDTLVFIDTNVLLDFYRLNGKRTSIKYVSEIEKHRVTGLR